MNLAPGTGVETSGCLWKEVIQHEMMHAMGMNHEQERPDRDKYVTIHFENIKEINYYSIFLYTVKMLLCIPMFSSQIITLERDGSKFDPRVHSSMMTILNLRIKIFC